MSKSKVKGSQLSAKAPAQQQEAPFLKTGPGFAIVNVSFIAILVLYFLVFWKTAEADEYNRVPSFGIDSSLAHHVLTSFSPIVGATIVGLRDVFLLGVGHRRRTAADERLIAAIPGIGRIYAVAFAGLLVAAICLAYISFPVSLDRGKAIIGVSASVWAGTLSYVLVEFFGRRRGR